MKSPPFFSVVYHAAISCQASTPAGTREAPITMVDDERLDMEENGLGAAGMLASFRKRRVQFL